MTRKLFGTDGVRGVAGGLLTAELALGLAQAATRKTGVERRQVLIVRDTRESGEMLEAAVAAGVSSAGGEALLGGVLPTPAAPLLIGRYGFDLAVVLEIELELERGAPHGNPPAIGRIRELRGAGEDYLRELHARFSALDLS